MYQYYIFELLAVIKQAIHKCFELQTMNITCHNNLKIIHGYRDGKHCWV